MDMPIGRLEQWTDSYSVHCSRLRMDMSVRQVGQERACPWGSCRDWACPAVTLVRDGHAHWVPRTVDRFIFCPLFAFRDGHVRLPRWPGTGMSIGGCGERACPWG